MKKTIIIAILFVSALAGTTRAAVSLFWNIMPNAAVAPDGTPLDRIIGTLDAGPGERITAIDFASGFHGTFYQDWLFNGAVPSVYMDFYGNPIPETDTHLLFAFSGEVVEAVTVTEDNDQSMSASVGWGTTFSGVIGILGDSQEQVTDFIQMYIPTGSTVNYEIIVASTGGSSSFVGYPLLEVFPELSCSVTDFSLVRVGTTAAETLMVENVGDYSSQLWGVFPSAGGEFGPGSTSEFGPIGQFESDSRQYTYTPTSRGSDTQNITVISNGGDFDVTLCGTGVGPVFDNSMAPYSTLDFDEMILATPESFYLDISNITTDENGGDNTLTDLTLLEVTIGGPDSDLFDIVGFSPDTLLHKGDVLCLELRYNGTGTPGLKRAVLNVFTDENAALGASGSSFGYFIAANVVPEPSALVLLIAGVCCISARRRRHYG